MPPKKRFTQRVLVFTIGSLALVFLALTLNFLRREYQLLEQGMRDKLLHIAATAAQSISGEEHEQIRGPEDPAFLKFRSLLRRIKRANHLKTELYTLARDPENPRMTRFVVMTNEKPFFGDRYPETDGLWRAFESGKPQTSAPYADKHGSWVSAYAPIKSKDGRVVAVLEVDQRESHLAALIYREGWQAFLFSLAILGIALPFVIRFGNSLTRPIKDLCRMTRRIQNGKPFEALPESKILEIHELQLALSKLAHVLRDREQLIQEKLQTLEETDVLRRNLITVVSHELKTPLTGIVAAAEFLATIELNEEERLEFTQDLLLQSHSMAAILDRLIQFSALQARPLPHQLEDIPLPRAVEDSLESLKQEVSQGHFEIGLMGLDGLWIRGEESRIRRALLEVLKNALEHSAHSRKIQIEAHQNGSSIELRIRDQGTGISDETLESAFAPLSQDGNLLVGKKAGLGMGLPLAKLSLEGIDAALEVESTGPKGTTILIRFVAGTPLLHAPSIAGESKKKPAL